MRGPVRADEAPNFTESTGNFESGGKKIEVDRYLPKGDGKRPAIVVLHGADGFSFLGGIHYKAMARAMARNGYAAYLVHYFNRTDTKFGDFKTCVTHFPTWLKTVDDAVSYVGRQPGADPKRIGVLGMSLGAFVALSYGSENGRVGAVVDFFGGLPEPYAKKLSRMPPTLILHGDKDHIIPVAEAEKLAKLLKEKKQPYEMKIYAGQAHGFTGDELKDALQRASDFFARNLKKE